MILEKIVESRMGENTYVVGDENTKKCIVVDPGVNLVDIMNFVKRQNLNVEYIVLTHGHGDHITNVLTLKEATNAKIVANEEEKEILIDKRKNLSASLPSNTVELDADIYVYEINYKVLGFIGIVDNYIAGIFVDKTYRCQNVGHQLINYIKKDHKYLILSVYQKNQKAVNFYIKEKFKIIKEQIDLDTNEVELVMEYNHKRIESK